LIEERWHFIRDFLCHTEFPEEWKLVVDYAESRPNINAEEWEEFRNLFCNNPGIREQEYWNFMSKLII